MAPFPTRYAVNGEYAYQPPYGGYQPDQQGYRGYYSNFYPQAPMDYSQQGYYQYPPGYGNSYGQQQQQQQQYQATPPQIRNPFPQPQAASQYAAQNAGFDPEYEAQVAQWQSAYAPQDQQDKTKKGGKNENPNLTTIGVRSGPQAGAENATATNNNKTGDDKQKTVVRSGGGKTWQDDSLTEWDPTQFRIYVGNLAGEVTDDSLAKAFAQYGVAKARVIRDKRTTKSKGFGFVSFTDNEMGFKAAKEMRGKYIGSHPVTINRSTTNVTPSVQKDKNKGKSGKGKDNKGDGKQHDPLKANTGAHIEKKPTKNAAGLKILG